MDDGFDSRTLVETPQDGRGARQVGAFLSAASFLTPGHVDLMTVEAWMEHGPFAFWLMDVLRPRVFVELGTHTGFSYFSMCQAVSTFGLPTRCHAIDTWHGDEHAGFYGEDVFARVTATNCTLYSEFSELIRGRFDDALPRFADGEIDLLHIDGRHTYEDVVNDFESWRRTLSARGVVLFHDINVRERDFGVWKLWRDLSERHPSFSFHHGHGLGVLAVGTDLPLVLRALFDADDSTQADIRSAYARLGRAVTTKRALLQAEADRAGQEIRAARERADTELRIRGDRERVESRIQRLRQEVADAERRLVRTEAQYERTRWELTVATRDLNAIRASTIWRATAPVRTLLDSSAARRVRPLLRRGARAVYMAAMPGRHQSIVTRPAVEPAGGESESSLAALAAWYANYRLGTADQDIPWQGATRFSILMPVYKVRPDWLEAAIRSVLNQTYPHWELICVDDNAQDAALTAILLRASDRDSRVRVVALDRNQGVSNATNVALEQATGDYVLFMDHDDLLEPHALARLGDAAFMEDGDILYGDEVVTTEGTDDIIGVQARPAFSHSYYLSYPFFVHPIAVRISLARDIGGLDVSLTISQDIDFVLRALEVAGTVTHVPDILYRWRTNSGSAGHVRQDAVVATTCKIKTAHLRRIGFPEAEVTPGISFNTFKIRYFSQHTGRILAVIPTKNQGSMLRVCVESLLATTRGLNLDIAIVDHESNDPETQRYLKDLADAGTARIVPYQGIFNYSAINNHAVKACGSGYQYFLFMNNDVEARQAGWLDAMVDLAMLSGVGAVGATLLYPSGSVQHSGVVIGMHGAAEHAFKTLPFRSRDPGYGAGLHATRDYSAVTAACMLVPAEAFAAVSGFDESLAVGFNDTDLCLRMGLKGYRSINCADAVLVHHESATRGKETGGDPHPGDTALFVSRYAELMQSGDPYFSPLLDKANPTFVMDPLVRKKRFVRARSVTRFLPKPAHGASERRTP